MTTLFSADQMAILELLRLATHDDAAVQRLDALRAAQEAAEKPSRDAEKNLRAAEATLAEARDLVAKAERRNLDLDDFEKRLHEVQNGLNAEKSAWEQVRQKVDAEQHDRDVALAAGESVMAGREKTVADLMGKNTAEAEELAMLRHALETKMAKLHAALADD